MAQDVVSDAREGDGEFDEIERRDTGLRIALTVLFVIVDGVVESLLAVVVLLSLVVALVTQRPPSSRLREFANRALGYRYRIARYLTYNESRIPFPFSEFPEVVEPERWRADEPESLALGWPDSEHDDERNH